MPREPILVSLIFLINIMSQFGVALLFVYRNLITLALISATISISLTVFDQFYQKPFLEHMKQSQSEN